MGAVKPWHIIVLVVVLILLFGAKRLPDAARSLGRSLRIIKAETRGLAEDDVERQGRGAVRPAAAAARSPDDEPSPLDDPCSRVSASATTEASRWTVSPGQAAPAPATSSARPKAR